MPRSLPRFSVVALAALALTGSSLRADTPDAYPEYVSRREVSGRIRSWGHGFLKAAMHLWEAGFQRHHPQARFYDRLDSSAAAMAGLYSGEADLGILVREITPAETVAYQKFSGQKPFPVQVLTGSYGDPDKLMALGLFVRTDNPIAQLSFAQLDGIFGAEHRRSPANLRTWGDLGLGSDWHSRPIVPFSGPASEAPGAFFSQRVLGGSVLWNSALRQFDDVTLPDGKTQDGYRRVLDAAADEPGAIALTGAGYRNPRMKLVAIEETPGGPFVAATPETVIDRSYPLSRPVRLYLNQGPVHPADADAVEFLRFAVSREGQEAIRQEGVFLPLPPEEARRQMAALDRILAEVDGTSPPGAGLQLVARVKVPWMTGTWDHLTADGASGRLFVSAQDQDTVDVIDLHADKALPGIAGLFHRPQGQCYLGASRQLAVTSGKDGTCRILDGETFALQHTIQLAAGADMMDLDPCGPWLIAESGGTDSKRGPGHLTFIDPATGAVAGAVVTGLRAAAFALERGSDLLYAAIPGGNQVAVIDRRQRTIVRQFPVSGRPACLALDEAGRRLFVTTRTYPGTNSPAKFLVLDAGSGRILAELPSPDGVENMFYDPLHHRIYTTSLEGPLAVYRQEANDRYTLAARIPVAPHAGTSQFVPELNRLCVAVPPEKGAPGEIWIFSVK